MRKLLLSLLASVGLASAGFAAIGGGIGGAYIQNTNNLQPSATFYVSSGTARNLNVTTLKFNDGTTMTTASIGGGGGGSSALQVALGGVQVSSPTASINFSSNAFTATQSPTGTSNIGLASGSTLYIQNNANPTTTTQVFRVSSASVNGQFMSNNGQLRVFLTPNTTTAMQVVNVSTQQAFVQFIAGTGNVWKVGNDISGNNISEYSIFNDPGNTKVLAISTNNVITVAGTIIMSPLTATRPLKLDASKNIISSLIDLTTDVTGSLPSGNLPSNVVYTNNSQVISGSKIFTASQTFTGGINPSEVKLGTATLPYNNMIVDNDGDFWILANASYTATTGRFNRISANRAAWGLEMQGRGLFPGEIDSGWVVWRATGATPGDLEISNNYGAVGGWELGFDVTSNRDLVVGGGAIEVDGFGTFPFGRVIHSNLSGRALTGVGRNLYNDLGDHDSDVYPEMFVGFSSDTFIVAYSTPQVASNLRNHLVISTGTAPIVTLGQMAVASIKWPDGTVQVSSGSGGGGGGGTPAGNNGNLQYNNAGAFGGIATSTFTPSTNSLVIGATTTILGTTANFSGNVTMTISSGSQLITSTGSFSNFQGSVTMRTVSISSNVYVLNKSSIVFVDPNLKTVRFYLDQTTDSYSVKLPGANPSVDDYLKITACTGFNCTASWAPSAAAGFTAGTLVRSNFATSNTPASTTNNTWFDTGICATDSQLGGVGSVNRITAVGNLTTADIGVSGAFATILRDGSDISTGGGGFAHIFQNAGMAAAAITEFQATVTMVVEDQSGSGSTYCIGIQNSDATTTITWGQNGYDSNLFIDNVAN